MPAPTAAGRVLRAPCVGASELLAILVLYPDLFPELEGQRHPYTSATAVYLRVVGGIEYRAETPSMRLGDRLEPAIARIAARDLGLVIRRASRTYVHPTTRLAASPDYLVLSAPELLEVKLSGDYGLWSDLPLVVEYQARAQLACTDRERVHVAALVGSSLRTFVVDRDPEREQRMLAAVDRFIEHHVVPGIPPREPDVPAELVLTVNPPAGTAAASGELAGIGDALGAVVGSRKRAEASETALRDALMREMGARDVRLLVGEGWRAEITETRRGIASLRFSANGAAPMP